MTKKEIVLETLKQYGRAAAKAIQAESSTLSGTELNAKKDFVPDFQAAKKLKNMLERKAGQTDGFVCRSSSGRVVRLIQTYDSEIYPQEPEELPAQWRFVWSKNPYHALEFISLATSPFDVGECCTHEGHVWQSGQANNVWTPGTLNIKWNDLGPIGGPFEGFDSEGNPL